MSAAGYRWRQLNQKQREELLEWRKAHGYPWHSSPHRPIFGHLRFLVSASCYEHRHYIGQSLARMDNFAGNLLAMLRVHANQTFAWCVLPNHYHALVEAADIKRLVYQIGAASRPHFARLEHRRTDSRAKSFLPCRRARDAFGSALLGDVELRSP
jgi:REP element-mobilizing transposase RayT